ncbi:MAG: hypothetical protein QOD93_1011, partial [Acetobacteraceae bacterium]|nr:hypothetical protein [Acetobacteraceae bacterium]
RILIAYGELTLDAETIAILRLVIAECDHFPEIAAAFYERAIVRTDVALVAWLKRQCERGLIRLEDPQAASGMLRGMMVQEPQRAVMLGQREAPGADEIAARARACARLFLTGCRAMSAVSTAPGGEKRPTASVRCVPVHPGGPDGSKQLTSLTGASWYRAS